MYNYSINYRFDIDGMAKKRKQYLWLPYISDVNLRGKQVKFIYKGGELTIRWMDIHSIMFYGESVDFPQKFLEKCSFYKIPVIIHRRNMTRAVIIAPTLPPDQENILERQILFRKNKKKRAYIGKRLLQSKFKSINWLFPTNRNLLYRLTDLNQMLSIESWCAKRYWQEFFKQLKINGKRRKGDSIVRKALDASSKFVSGIILRWILYHSLSPYHGFLHKPTDYPALVYDLMEPYRGYFDKVIFDTARELQKNDSKNDLEDTRLIGASVENLKKLLEEKVYVDATRQVVTFHELLHGVVLALRAYLLGNCKRFVVPIPSKPNGGRPINAGYKLYGHHAGKTNFWPETKKIAQNFAERFSPITGLSDAGKE